MALIKQSPAQAPNMSDESSPPEAKPTPNTTKSQTILQYALPIAAVTFLIINIGLFAYLRTKTANIQPTPVPTPIPSPTPTPKPTPTPYPLPQGKRSFQLSYGKNTKGPKLGKITINPFDPQMGDKQTYTITVTHDKPVISADLALYTDNKIATYSLERTSGTDTNGTWEVTLTTTDTHFYEYYAYFIVKSKDDEFSGGLTFRAY